MSTGNSKSSESLSQRQIRSRKRKMMPDNMPRAPVTGYVIFMNEQKELMKQSDNKMLLPEFGKAMGQKWALLDSQQKQKYTAEADADKLRYEQEMKEYKKTDEYKNWRKKMANEAKKKEVTKIETKDESLESVDNESLEIPIFTEEFLSHNKVREGELRQIRKSAIEYEEQNIVLQKHIDSIKDAISKLEFERGRQESKNTALTQHLQLIRKTLAHALANVPLPGTMVKPTEHTVDTYLTQLHSVLTNYPQQHTKVVQNVKQIVNNVANNLA